MTAWSRLVAGALAAVALTVGPSRAADPLTPPPVIPAGLASEPAGPILDLTPPALPGPAHTAVYAPGVRMEAEKAEQPAGFFASADLMFGRPRFSDNAFALVDPLLDLSPSGRVREVNPDSRAGLRVGGGYRLESGWGVGLTYSYLQSRDGLTVAAPAGGTVYPLLTRPGIVDRADTAFATAGITYQLFDLDFSKTVALDKHLSLTTFGGVRFVNLNTDLGADYDSQLARQAAVRTTSKFIGAGPTAGATATWTAGPVGLFGTARGGLVYGRFDGTYAEANGGVGLADVSDRSFGVAPVVSVGVGGSYAWRGVSLAVGYEVTQWFGAISRPTFTDDFADGRVARRRTDLSLDGVFIRLTASY